MPKVKDLPVQSTLDDTDLLIIEHDPSGTDVTNQIAIADFRTGIYQIVTLPGYTTSQRNALTAVNGMLIYNTSASEIQQYAASAWSALAGGGGGGGASALTGLSDVSISTPIALDFFAYDAVNSLWVNRPIAQADVTGLVTALAGLQPIDSDLTTIAGLTATTNNIIMSVGSAWASRTPTQVKSALSLDVVLNTVQVNLQASSPGSAQTGHLNITGTGKVGTAIIGSLSGVLKASSGTVAGSATTDDLTEGSGNLYFDNGRVRTNRLDQMAAPAADVSMASNKITNVADPVGAQDAATKNYVDVTIQGLQQKPSATVVATSALPANTYSNGASGLGSTLTATGNGALTVDSYAVAANDLVLVTAESSGLKNGLYVVTQEGSSILPYILTRHADMDTTLEFLNSFLAVGNQGTVNSNSLWLCTNSSNPTVGTTAITFVELNKATDINVTAPIAKSGNTLSLGYGNGLTVSGANLVIDTSITADKTTAQTFTNKTLTAPTITSPIINVTSDADGDIYYRASGAFTRLPKGTAFQALRMNSGATAPEYATLPLIAWTEVTGTTQTATVLSGYILNNAAQVVVTLPSTAAVGDIIELVGKGAGGWKLAQNSSQLVRFGSSVSTTGTGGSIASTNQYDCLTVICIVANTTFTVKSSIGNLTIV